MSITPLFGARVLAMSPDRLTARLRIFVVHYGSDPYEQVTLNGEHCEFLRHLWDFAMEVDGPLATRVTMEQLYDEIWLDDGPAAFIEDVRQLTPVAGQPPTGADLQRLHDHPDPYGGGWPGEDGLVRADYLVRVTDPRWFDHLRPGVTWTSSWHPVWPEAPEDRPHIDLPDEAVGPTPELRQAERLADQDADLEEIRQAFEAAQPLDTSAPPLAEVGLYSVTGNSHALAPVLERLKAGGGEDYPRACRLATRLGSRVLMKSTRPLEHPLLELLAGLDGDPESAANALWLRGRLRFQKGAYDEARDVWAQAAATGVRPYADWAANGLAAGGGTTHLHDRDDRLITELADELFFADRLEEALHAYSLAAETEMTEKVAHCIGDIHRKQGRPAEAAEAYERALELSDGWNATTAAFNLAAMRAKLGDHDGAVAAAREAHRRCVTEGQSRERRAKTATHLGDMLRLRGDWAEAKAAYEEAIQTGQRKKRGEGQLWSARWTYIGLGEVKAKLGETDAARELLQRVLQQCGPVSIDMPEDRRKAWAAATERLGHIAKNQRDAPQAESWYHQIIEHGTPREAVWATAHLAELHYWLDHHDHARTLYQRVLDRTKEAELVAEAAFRLGELTAQAGDHPRAMDLMETAIATADPSFMPQAADLLARLRERA
ncbi:lipopolysaccharide assembly protein LapB [Nonomuraea sp. NEAU-A123]|uniref:tetratricopeptide repeat protein n=1 Tax=Nonomuraea sp. NEAU-A123 TaxID=2839649 RepID=UPI001BE41C4D|nr:tetratricopeptide repeat protein [Nonomuraea sp. NEAU-A123]MBT2224370.1 tetratricopeptide repeat protein [Nonomuraea sp. NEAU-A123]